MFLKTSKTKYLLVSVFCCSLALSFVFIKKNTVSPLEPDRFVDSEIVDSMGLDSMDEETLEQLVTTLGEEFFNLASSEGGENLSDKELQYTTASLYLDRYRSDKLCQAQIDSKNLERSFFLPVDTGYGSGPSLYEGCSQEMKKRLKKRLEKLFKQECSDFASLDLGVGSLHFQPDWSGYSQKMPVWVTILNYNSIYPYCTNRVKKQILSKVNQWREQKELEPHEFWSEAIYQPQSE